MDSALDVAGQRKTNIGTYMDYKDILEQSKRNLDSTLERLKKKNSEILGSFGYAKEPEVNPGLNRGVILTDTSQLASEYNCGRSEVSEVLNDYISNREVAGFKWHLLDIAEIEKDFLVSWHRIIGILSEFNNSNPIASPGNPIPLFIIGNDEVIPMPRIENPTPQVIGGEYIDADYRYAFLVDGDENDYSPFMGEPSFFVGRLPVPASNERNLQELSDYLTRCCAIEDAGGMDVNNATMVSTETWIRSSKDMVADIPISKVNPDTVLSIEGKLLLSPNLDMDEFDSYQAFSEIEKKADYLVFNLHGSDQPEATSYYGEDINCWNYPEGFCTDLLHQNAPQIMIATACFGARFINYGCDGSMLLSAISNGTLLFIGSCVTALGNPDGAGFSEYLVKLLNVYLHQGIPAGEALSKAKQVYYRDKTEDEGCEYSLFTNLEFNLFGNPILTMRPILPMDYVPKGSKDVYGRSSVPTFKAEEFKVHSKGGRGKNGDILSQVRGEVDRGLDKIAQTIQDELYDRLGMQGTELESIIEFGAPGRDCGYYYTFNKACGKFDSKAIAKTDQNGSIKQIIVTK